MARAEKDAALAALFETGTAGISEVDLPSGRFVRVNRRFCEIMRREADLLLTLGPGEVIHPNDRDAVKAQWMAAMKIGGAWEAEVRHIAPDSEAFWVRIGVSVWKRDDAGLPVRCIAVLQDITESVKVKERLQQSEQLLRLGQQVGRIGSFSRDLRTGWLHCSAETSHIFGLPPGEGPFSSQTWFNVFLAEDRTRVMHAIVGEPVPSRRGTRGRLPGAARRRRRRPAARTARPLFLRRRRPAAALGRRGHRRHRAARGGGAARPRRPPRRADRPRQPRSCFRECVEDSAHAPQHRRELRRALPRSRPLQGRQRHPGPPAWATACLSKSRRDCGRPCGRGTSSRASAATSSPILLRDLDHPEDAGRLAQRRGRADRRAVSDRRAGIAIGVSIGVAVAPRDGVSTRRCVSAADLALYEAKSQPARGWRYFEPRDERAGAAAP